MLFLNRMMMVVETGMDTNREKMLTSMVETDITVVPMCS